MLVSVLRRPRHARKARIRWWHVLVLVSLAAGTGAAWSAYLIASNPAGVIR